MSVARRKARHARSAGAPSSVEHVQVTRHLARGGVALLANSGLNAILGVAFWLVAARMLTSVTVGRGSALVSALFTVSGLCQLNYARSMSGLLPRSASPRRLLARIYGVTAGVSFAVGLGAALGLPWAAGAFSYLRGNVLFVVTFAASAALWTIFNLEDGALTSVRAAIVVPVENGTYGLLKLVCLLVFWDLGYRTTTALFLAWVLPLVVVIVPVNLFLFLRAVPAAGPPAVEPAARASPWLRYDFAGYLLWLAGTVPLPVVVLISVGAAKSASFYVPFTIATSIDLLSLMLGNSLTAELSRAGGVMTAAIKSHVRRVWIGVGVLGALLCLLAPEILQLFGDKYRTQGTIILRILMIATLPRSILFVGIAVQRSRGNGRAIVLLQAIASAGTLSLGFVLAPLMGAAGTALGWLIASSAAALVTAFLLPVPSRAGSRRATTSRGVPKGRFAVGLQRPRAQPDSGART